MRLKSLISTDMAFDVNKLDRFFVCFCGAELFILVGCSKLLETKKNNVTI
jgi:hypothetical protein